jgi:hypothetical protein
LICLLFVLILKGGYTASLSSIILSQQRSVTTIASFQELQKSSKLIGYQEGSFTLYYLKNTLNINLDRLVNLTTQKDYDDALKSRRVAAIIDESPYIEAFLSNLSCSYKRADSNIAYFGGLAFVSPPSDPCPRD